MSEQNHLELGRVILDFPIQAYTIKSLHVHEEANAHGSLSLLFVARGPVSEQDCIRYADSPIRILDDQGNPIFCGICSLISTHNLNQYCEVQIEAHTHSQKMDVAAHSRTFQDPGKMLSQVLEQMLEPYGALFQIQEDKVIPEISNASAISLGIRFLSTAKSLTSSFPLALSPFLPQSFHPAQIPAGSRRISPSIGK